MSRSTIYGVEPIQRVGERYDHGEKEVKNGNSLNNEQRITKGYGTQSHASSVRRPRVERVGVVRIVPEELDSQADERTLEMEVSRARM